MFLTEQLKHFNNILTDTFAFMCNNIYVIASFFKLFNTPCIINILSDNMNIKIFWVRKMTKIVQKH